HSTTTALVLINTTPVSTLSPYTTLFRSGMKAGMRNNNTKPVPPRNPDQKASQNEQQFSTNAINNPNVESKTNTVPTKPNTSIPGRSGSLASSIPVNTSNVSGSDSDGSSNVGGVVTSSSQHKTIVNTGGHGHIHTQR